MLNHLHVFRIQHLIVNTAGEYKNIESKEFIESKENFITKEIKNYIDSKIELDFLERMKLERIELTEKINKLIKFLDTEENNPRFTNVEQRRMLSIQLQHMQAYYAILRTRIDYEEAKELKK